MDGDSHKDHTDKVSLSGLQSILVSDLNRKGITKT